MHLFQFGTFRAIKWKVQSSPSCVTLFTEPKFIQLKFKEYCANFEFKFKDTRTSISSKRDQLRFRVFALSRLLMTYKHPILSFKATVNSRFDVRPGTYDVVLRNNRIVEKKCLTQYQKIEYVEILKHVIS